MLVLILLPDFSYSQTQVLMGMPIVPVPDNPPRSTTNLLPPNQCYFKGKASSELYSKLFAFVDFGYQGNIFLKAIGTRDEPTVEEIALVLAKDSEAFFHSAGGRKR